MVDLVKTATEFELSPTLAANEMVANRRAKGQKVLHMGFGESPFPVPERLQRSLIAGVERKEYLPTVGLPELRECVAQYYREKIGLDTDQFDVIVAPGSKLILYSLQMAVDGDLLMPVPSWVSYAPQARMLHTNVIKVPTRLDCDGLYIDPVALEQTIQDARAQGLKPSKIILNYPSNPTGLTMSEENLKEIAVLCVREDILIISDEIYGFVNFDGNYRTIAKYAPTHTALTSGLSKHLSLGGWRIGIGFIPKAVDGLQNLLSNIASETWSCVPAPIQQAVIDAYSGHDDIENHIADCTAIHSHMNRYISSGLRAAGIFAPEPQGAFYNYPNFSKYAQEFKALGVETSGDLAQYLIEEYGLASLPGTAFGADPQILTLRLSGCDYDGALVLQAYQGGAVLNEAFIERYAPNIKAQVAAFQDMMTRLGVQANAVA